METINNITFYKQLFEKLQVSILVIDIDTNKIVEINEKAKKLLNLNNTNFNETHYLEVFHKDTQIDIKASFESAIKKLLTDKKVKDLEYVVLNKNNKMTPIEIVFNLIKSENKNYLILMLKDLTLRKQREKLIGYYNKALEKSSSFLALVDKDYRYLQVNDYYSKFFGIKKEDFIGKKMSFIFGKEYFNNIVKEKFDKALEGEAIQFNTNVKLNEKEHYLQVFYEPYYNNNIVESVVVHVYDMTKFKEYEDDNLQKEKLLIQQSKMAAMGEMLENIAHQWRQPLSVISTCTSGITLQKEFNTLTDEILDESLQKIMNTTSYLSNTIDDFKNFFERDKEKSVFNVSSLINKTIDLIEMSLSSSDIEICRQVDDTITIENYKNEFMQVLLNIINNAKDALILNKEMQNERKIIKIALYKNDDKVVLDIVDNAGGIPQNIQEKIFEPYFTTKHQSQGTGIGLFMTREIITKHMEGEIIVKNLDFDFEKKSYYGALFRIVI
ncbi:PAS domain S-box protein [Malaciobacter sp. WC5094]